MLWSPGDLKMTTLRSRSSSRASFALALVLFLGAVTPSFAHITAGDVTDRSTLRAFVERAVELAEQEISNPGDAYAFFDRTFRPEGEWRMGSIYLYVSNTSGVIRFHGARRDLEGVNLYNRRDRTGKLYVQELIRAAEAGGGFVEYYFDNPAVVGDEEEGSLKIGYVQMLDIGGERRFIGSGIYPADSVPVAPPLALLALATLLAGGAYRRLRRG